MALTLLTVAVLQNWNKCHQCCTALTAIL